MLSSASVDIDQLMQLDAPLEKFNAFVQGREQQLSAARAALTNQDEAVDRPYLRLLVLDALKRDYCVVEELAETGCRYLISGLKHRQANYE